MDAVSSARASMASAYSLASLPSLPSPPSIASLLSMDSLLSQPSLPNTPSIIPAEDRLDYLTKMISSLDAEMSRVSLSVVKSKTDKVAEEIMDNMRACTSNIADVSWIPFFFYHKNLPWLTRIRRLLLNVQIRGRDCGKGLQPQSVMAVQKLAPMLINCVWVWVSSPIDMWKNGVLSKPWKPWNAELQWRIWERWDNYNFEVEHMANYYTGVLGREV